MSFRRYLCASLFSGCGSRTDICGCMGVHGISPLWTTWRCPLHTHSCNNRDGFGSFLLYSWLVGCVGAFKEQRCMLGVVSNKWYQNKQTSIYFSPVKISLKFTWLQKIAYNYKITTTSQYADNESYFPCLGNCQITMKIGTILTLTNRVLQFKCEINLNISVFYDPLGDLGWTCSNFSSGLCVSHRSWQSS